MMEEISIMIIYLILEKIEITDFHKYFLGNNSEITYILKFVKFLINP